MATIKLHNCFGQLFLTTDNWIISESEFPHLTIVPSSTSVYCMIAWNSSPLAHLYTTSTSPNLLKSYLSRGIVTSRYFSRGIVTSRARVHDT